MSGHTSKLAAACFVLSGAVFLAVASLRLDDGRPVGRPAIWIALGAVFIALGLVRARTRA